MKYLQSLIIVVIFSCSAHQEYVIKTEPDGSKILVGHITREILFSQNPEWSLGLEYYRPDQAVINSLRQVNKMIRVEIFLGTWCGDSRREVPHFLKIADQLEGMIFEHIEIWGVDRQKTIPGSRLPEKRNIKYVATFIFYDDDREIGRIVEQPKGKLESDILSILLEN